MTVVCLAASGLRAGDAPYHEPYRPQLHYSPPRQWMNDPNGMVWLDGEYHLFYQYFPDGNRWGPMHWGHAVSRDLVHWETLPIALYPDAHGMIFSGSVIYDRDNSSGLGTRDQPPLVALFTNHDEQLKQRGSDAFETQGLAYSLDHGRSWTKYAGNPVLPNAGMKDFRDPKVSWFEPQQKWIMTLAAGDHVAFYASRDLKNWTHESDFGTGLGEHGGVWECPDLVRMRVAGETADQYVLLASFSTGAPNGGSATQYFVGGFDGHAFTPVEQPVATRWIDAGTDDYAGVTWSNVPAADGRTLFIGWMSNWTYAQQVPTLQWRSAMTLPRELRLVRTARGLEVHAMPVAEVATLRGPAVRIGAQVVQQELRLGHAALLHTGLLELNLRLDMRDAKLVTLVFSNPAHQLTQFRINRELRRYELDRSTSGAVDFNPGFAALQTAPIKGAAEEVSLRVIVDHSSLEVFVNDGETVMTALVFPATPYDSVTLRADRAIKLEAATLYGLRSIWATR